MAGIQKTWEGAFSRGLEENVCEGYNFLYEDRFYKNVPIGVIGVFDTVGALGLPNNTLYDFTNYNSTEHGFHDTDVQPQLKHAFQALALDDHRAPFSPTLWHLPTRNTTTKLIQCWCPGRHIHIGGGSEETVQHVGDLESMASLSLTWMNDRVREHTNLQFESYELTRLYQTYINTVLDLSQRSFKRWDKAHIYSYAKGDGKNYDDEADPDNRTGYGGWGMGSRPDSMTFEYIHPVVAYALGKPYREVNQGPVLRYQPEALKNFTRVKDPKTQPPSCSFPDMPLSEDTDSNLLNERDYTRADWLAFLAPRLWFPEPTIDHINKYLKEHKESRTLIESLTERETDLLYHLTVKAQSQLTRVWQMRSVAFKLRQKIPSKGNEENVKLMLDTGARTRNSLALLDRGELYPEEEA
ncbi:hypothetical protein ASPACDRAFT_43527 [Aspergillus aculeatus ATCC 16872]|uniref:T6SS Phospholipase effector Tle1-like catalytic domain-containing protein n=1 Tax=Aspergillus aculeatus (strain ATCC 16872 / CBS 172.66 / WB 5094) TaxID=690307 RepID=A0A1L9WUU4_ASPA1|nr:uncharacterized protein ASPACDRAFT_43527 [Aspergillus aculeatus ATCC 16872]OJJ99893.1 hypothetical protein ASPACDRAFT_43527 [Aspergillus aculeatus ATCC 16872]